jgi:uncharacterized protein (DUF1919 family)
MKSIISKLRHQYFLAKRKLDRLFLRNKDFSLFSNDCWGGELYQYFDLAYSTPFVGLYVMAPCYLKLLKNPKQYLGLSLSFAKVSKYEEVELTREKGTHKFPVGVLDDIEIQFMHYKSEEEAKSKWERRVSRINWDNIFVKIDGSKDCATYNLMKDFDSLSYSKICIVKDPQPSILSAVLVKDWENDGAKMFYKTNKVFSIRKWLNHL